MNDLISQFSKTLEPIFKNLPPLPKGAKDWFAKAWPILVIIAAVLQLLAAWSLWHVGHLVNSLVTYTNALSRIYGTGVTVNNLGFFYWVSLIFLVVDAIILFMAYPGLKARRLAGWNMLFLGAVVNVLYGVLTAFDSNYGGVGQLILTLIASAVGFYLLFQVRSYYVAEPTSKKQT